ncbi:SPASM domain-containing protein [Cellulosispirillum alkaliphilum]|uniref:SPASM domain-containing protein n=1 Tax=Cellulosispirillum alkaliphilum TaxID=3039283 RepID=UPI003D6EC7E3
MDSFSRDYIRFNTLTSGHEEETTTLKRCSEIYFTIYIRWDGLVPLCGHIHWYSDVEWAGDVHKNSIQDLWNCSRLTEIRNAHHGMDLACFEFCKRYSKTQYSEITKQNIVKT